MKTAKVEKIRSVNEAMNAQREQVKMSDEQIKIEKEHQRKNLILDKNCYEREVLFKEEQINSNNITETRAINQIPGQPSVILDGYRDGLKPKHIIQNEIDTLKRRLEIINERLDSIL